jgi:5-formyltetrahydrofolate cyclo-ligase
VRLLKVGSLAKDTYFLPKLRERVYKQGRAYIHFDEMLRCHTINAVGIYDNDSHYDILSEALIGVPGIIFMDAGETRFFLKPEIVRKLGL